MKLPLLQVRSLSVDFPQGRVVNEASFNIELGEKIALVGESGSGKSVMAMSLVRLIESAKLSGRILWIPQDEDTLNPEATEAPQTLDLVKLPIKGFADIRGQDIAFVFQEPMTALNPLFTVGDQIAEVLEIKRGMRRRDAWGEAVSLLHQTGIPDPALRANAYPHQLSGGQRQQIGRAHV